MTPAAAPPHSRVTAIVCSIDCSLVGPDRDDPLAQGTARTRLGQASAARCQGVRHFRRRAREDTQAAQCAASAARILGPKGARQGGHHRPVAAIERPTRKKPDAVCELRNEENQIVVPDRLTTPHTLVAATNAAGRYSKPDRDGLLQLYGPDVLPLRVAPQNYL